MSYEMVYSCDSDKIEICQDGRLELEYTSEDSLEEMEERLLSILLDMLAGDPYAGGDSDFTYEMPEVFLKQLWDMVIALVEQIPHTHEAQCTMMKLILELQKIPEEEEARIASGKLILPWKQLCGLNSCMEEHFRYNGIFGRFVDAQKVKSWINLHAFTAALFGRGLMNWRYVGILIFHDTLEQNSTGQSQEANIQAMAQ
ncbi:uncharacterized protein N7496_005542 [Penicillium cataractarum]|uniref:Uncharacterized protein n=1 Tax=Penicillium cataractarum TaxID=2100454 RepID=A0A9W9SKS3_9EURO|nr:uncharacterized protein N7496_005542 [Penicillium cataractarum]KAJ5378133.1 hypothetical protein N7496_005542 [Penicillium cataractarum]